MCRLAGPATAAATTAMFTQVCNASLYAWFLHEHYAHMVGFHAHVECPRGKPQILPLKSSQPTDHLSPTVNSILVFLQGFWIAPEHVAGAHKLLLTNFDSLLT